MDWEKVLKNPSNLAINRIADLLARLGFEPDKKGMPQGDWPPISKLSPLTALDAMGEVVSVTVGGVTKLDPSHKRRADTLKVATLLWCGATEDEIIKRESERDGGKSLLVYSAEVWYLRNCCDLESFWDGRGRGKTKTDILDEWRRGDWDITPEQIADMLKDTKTGTFDP